MSPSSKPEPLEEVLAYYARGTEDPRLLKKRGVLERHRTHELLQRYLPPAPAVVLDVGGGSGHYAVWLAARGYEVHLIDPVPLHLEQARARLAEQSGAPLDSIREGDARQLVDWDSDQVDAVLLLGPLYHLPERSDRLQALREAWRVLRPGGQVMAAAISRFASALDGLVSHFFTDPRYAPIVWQDLTDGRHHGAPDGAYFTTAYLHQPEELVSELVEAGFGDPAVVAIEGPGWLLQDFENQWADPPQREALLEVIRRTETEPSLLGASSHLMAIGRKARVRPATMDDSASAPLVRKIDCLQLPVPDLDAGLAFYCDRLGHALIWRTATAAGLRLPDTDAEIVLQTERPEMEVDLLVDSADAAVNAWIRAGGRVIVQPFGIPIGRCAVVADPWGNRLVVLDSTKGSLVTDASGVVLTDAHGAPRVQVRD